MIGVAVFGLMTWTITIYLNSGDRTVAVQIDPGWLQEQGANLTLAVDDDEYTLSSAELNMDISVGEHGFAVRDNGRLIHNPQTFTIEDKGRQVLHIDATGMRLAGRTPPSNPSAISNRSSPFENNDQASGEQLTPSPTRLAPPATTPESSENKDGGQSPPYADDLPSVAGMPVFSGGINDVSISPDGRYFAVAADEHEVVLWDNQDSQIVQLNSEQSLRNVRSLLWASNGSTLIAAGERITRVSLSDRRVVAIARPRRLTEHVTWLSQDRQFGAYARGHGLVLYDAASLREISSVGNVIPNGRQCFGANSDRTQLLTCDASNELGLFDIANQKLTPLGLFPIDRPIQMRFVPGREEHVLVAGEKGLLELYDVEERRLVRALDGHTENVSSLDLFKSGQFAVSGSPDDTIRVWHLNSGSCVQTFEGSQWNTSRIDISPDERYVISGGGKRHGPGGRGAYVRKGNNVRLWRLHPEEELTRLAEK